MHSMQTACRLVLTPFSNSTGGPWAVWNVSSGEVHFDARVMAEIARFPGQVSSAVGAIDALFAQISRQPLPLSSLFSTAAPAAIALGLGSQVPLWFCIACPIVLGLVAPFIFNAGTSHKDRLKDLSDPGNNLMSLPFVYQAGQ